MPIFLCVRNYILLQPINNKSMKRPITIICLLAGWMETSAQRTCVIADMETRKPIHNALIMTDTHHGARTNLYGYFEMKYNFDSATVSHPSFFSLKVKRTTLPDTVFLLRKTHLLQEVTIYGTDLRKQSISSVQNAARRAAAEAPTPGGGTVNITFDFANLLDRRRRHDRKQLKKLQEIFKKMDEMDEPKDTLQERLK